MKREGKEVRRTGRVVKGIRKIGEGEEIIEKLG
jgi:hypothetical protein